VYDRMALPAHVLGNHKTLNKTIHIAASIFCQKRALDDAVIINHLGEVAEVISSNIYLVMRDRILTPSLDSGCLNGTIRKVLMKNRQVLPLPLAEGRVSTAMLADAREVWTTNAGTAIRWFRQIGAYRYTGEAAKTVQEKLRGLALNSMRDFPGIRP